MSEQKSLIIEILNHLKNPKDLLNFTGIKPTFTRKIYNIFRIWGIEIVMTFILGIILSTLLILFKYDNNDHAILALFEESNMLLLFFLGGIYAPIVEEVTFRLGLKFSPFRVSFSLSFLLLFITQLLESYKIVNLENIFITQFNSNSTIYVFVFYLFFVLFAIGLGFLLRINLLQNKLRSIHEKYFNWIFYLSAIIFGIAHATNYTDIQNIWFLIPFLGLPQIFIGIILGFVRLRYGMFWTILLHAIHNSLTMFPLIAFGLGSENLKNLVLSSNSNNSEQLATLLTTTDYMIIFGVLIYFLMIFLVILVIWIQVLIEFARSRR